MPRHVALLRAVNVGGTGVIAMAEVRALLAAIGLVDVETVGASGNVLFDSPDGRPDLRRRIEEALGERMRRRAVVLLRTAAEMRAIVQQAPQWDGADAKRYVAFLSAPPVASIPARMPGTEVHFHVGRPCEVYVQAARTTPPGTDPVGFLEKSLGKGTVTLRAWSVVQSLADRMG